MKTVVIACSTIKDELNLVMSEIKNDFPIVWIESGLHIKPGSLKKQLQEELDKLFNVDQALLAFGYCSNSLIGLTPPSYRMIFPRADDCISLLLGSDQKRQELTNEKGTYFLTKGWLNYERNIWGEYLQTLKRYGKEKTDMIYKTMLNNYQRLGIIETGAYELETFLEQSKIIAETLDLTPQVIPGTLRYLKKLITGPWDEEFIIINPGEKVSYKHICG